MSLALELGSLIILTIITLVLAIVAFKTEHGWLRWLCELVVFISFTKAIIAGPLECLATALAFALFSLAGIWLVYGIYCTARMLWVVLKGVSTFVDAIRFAVRKANESVSTPPT